jgi:GntR family transcriptional regulator / MocR family aminotransferase
LAQRLCGILALPRPGIWPNVFSSEWIDQPGQNQTAMPRVRSTAAIPSLGAIDRNSGRVGQQLAQGLRDAIASGALQPGERLPSTRTLASSLGLARGTVVEAFDQLKAEGYLESLPRAGTAISQALLPKILLSNAPASPRAVPGPDLRRAPADGRQPLPDKAAWLSAIARALDPPRPQPFAVVVPAGAAAPDEAWRRLGNRVRASRAAAPAGYGDPCGLPELRAAIADYVRKARAVRCEPRQVVITAGSQQGLYFSAMVLLGAGSGVWIEDPAYPGITAVLSAFDAVIHRVAVDESGIDVERGVALGAGARAAFVTPSHQYPLGMPMSMARRLALLRWAQQSGAWIVEDDYDSELRYSGHPFPSLQGLDPSRVIYLGTMSKVMFPSLRLGYAIVPEPLVDAYAGARVLVDRQSPTADQHVLAAFMKNGMFEAHIRRIRAVYTERRDALIAALTKHLPGWATLQPSDQGMHLVVWLPGGMDDVGIMQDALAAGVVVRALSPMYSPAAARPGLMLGFGGFPARQLADAVPKLAAVLTRSRARRRAG